MGELTTSRKYANDALRWAKQPYPPVPSRTNFEELERLITAEIKYGHKTTIMRNQQQIGFNNNYWPALSRWLVMKRPSLIEVIHPRKVEDLDNEEGRIEMCALYRALTDEEPRVRSWQAAKEIYG